MYDKITKKRALELIKNTNYSKLITTLPDRLQNDEDIASAAIQQTRTAMLYIGKQLKENKKFLLNVVKQYKDVFKYVPTPFKSDIDIIAAAYRTDRSIGSLIPKTIFKNAEYASKLLSIDLNTFDLISESLKIKKSFLLDEIKKYPSIFKKLNDALKNDKDLAFAAVKAYSWNIRFVSKELLHNKELTLIAVEKDGKALQFCDENLKDDIDIVLAAVINDGDALQYASVRLKNNEDVVKKAIESSGISIEYSSKRLQKKKELVLEAIKHGALLYDLLPCHRNDPEIVKLVIKTNPEQLEHASSKLKNNIEIVTLAININGEYIRFCGNQLKNNLGLHLDAVFNNTFSTIYFSKTLSNNPIIKWLKKEEEHINKEDWPVVKEALLKNPKAILNPSPAILSLCDGLDNKYKHLALYSLADKLEKSSLPNNLLSDIYF